MQSSRRKGLPRVVWPSCGYSSESLTTHGKKTRLGRCSRGVGRVKMPSLSLRINLDPEGRIGAGKIELLEHIAAFVSTSAAARQIEMSYKRAWDLVNEMNRIGKPAVTWRVGQEAL